MHLALSRPCPLEENCAMDRPDRHGDRPAAAKVLDLPGLAHECESLVIRDPRLPQALVRTLLDIASALREEAARRGRD
jgi:hypothetical protein